MPHDDETRLSKYLLTQKKCSAPIAKKNAKSRGNKVEKTQAFISLSRNDMTRIWRSRVRILMSRIHDQLAKQL